MREERIVVEEVFGDAKIGDLNMPGRFFLSDEDIPRLEISVEEAIPIFKHLPSQPSMAPRNGIEQKIQYQIR